MARARQYGHGRFCPRCKSNWCVKNGKPDGRQVFLCRQCGHRFADSVSKEHDAQSTNGETVDASIAVQETDLTNLPEAPVPTITSEIIVVSPQPAAAPEPVVINPPPSPTIDPTTETPVIIAVPEPVAINQPPAPPINPAPEPPPEDAPAPPLSLAARLAQANSTVNSHTAVAMGIGLIPIAGVDMIALAASQLKMVHSLANLYNLNFCEQVGKSLIASLVGSATNSSIMLPLASALKFIPVLGQLAGPASSSMLSGATTRAIGKVFIQHFESGGTLLNLNPEKVRSYFAKQLKEGQQAIPKN